MISDLYKDKYKTAEQRALYLTIFKGYGSYDKMADDLDCQRQYIDHMMNKGVPAKYAGYLGRRFNLDPALLCYETYLMVATVSLNKVRIYESLLLGTEFFTDEDTRYILAGSYIKDPVKWLRNQDKQI